MARAGSPRLAMSSSWTEVGWSGEGSGQGLGKEEQFGLAACPQGQGECALAAGSSRRYRVAGCSSRGWAGLWQARRVGKGEV